MPTVTEGKLKFDFPAGYEIEKYDNWSFYINQFQKVAESKAVDFIVYSPNASTVWLLEVKDYRLNSRTKEIPVENEIAQKIRDTLAGMVAARSNTNVSHERGFAQRCLTPGIRFNVVLHIEQPKHPSRRFPREYDLADILQKLKALIKPIDAHPKVVEIATTVGRLPWNVDSLP